MATNAIGGGCDSYQEWTRRALLRGGAGAAASLLFGPSALAQIAMGRENDEPNALVVIFLRGGADGLSMVVPHQEDAYYKLRPSLALGNPRTGAQADRVIDLDGFFGLHPALKPLEVPFKEGDLALIQAVGSDDGTRSHFEAMAAMERGLSHMGVGGARTNGWLARYIQATHHPSDSPLRAVALTEVMPDTLRGAASAANIREVGDFRLSGDAMFRAQIESAYAKGTDEMSAAGRDTLTILKTLDRLDYRSYTPTGGATYPGTDLGTGLRQAAFLLKAGVGLEVAFLDKEGWDTHITQGASTGWLASMLQEVANSLAAFTTDMGEKMKRTSVIVMTEFGRRAYENGGLGTDHGRASVMFALGGGVKGGKVYGRWPGLEEKALVGPGDLEVTTDYRTVLREVLVKRQGLANASDVFPNLRAGQLGLWS